MRRDLREIEVGVRVRRRADSRPVRPARPPDWPSRRARDRDAATRMCCRSCHACSTHRGRPTCLSPPSTTTELKPMMRRLVGVAETEIQRVLARQKRDDMLARQFRAEIRHQMPKIVFFLRPDRAVGDHHAHVLPRERSNRVVGVDPRVDAFGGLQFRARRTELDGNDGRLGGAEEREERGQSHKAKGESQPCLRVTSSDSACTLPAAQTDRPPAGPSARRPRAVVICMLPSLARMPPSGPAASAHLHLHVHLVGDAADLGELPIHLGHRLRLTGLAFGRARIAEDPAFFRRRFDRSGCSQRRLARS